MSRYNIIGADGRQYGPVSGEQLQQWIAEGRANAQTQTFAEGSTEWKPLGQLPEFAGCFAPRTPPTISPPVSRSIRKTNSWAMAGLIFGLLAFFCCCKFLFGLLGIIFSLVGLSQINRQPEFYEGRGLAIAGLVLSILSLLLAVLLVLVAMATGNFQFHWGFHHF
ncbi:MAG TPA: DUF4190 domain-containing protein [Candidatus Acidoferrales bacterium]|nr:DUF4190 domain-containing protein [Candidatus Acidoferrales bacterium]